MLGALVLVAALAAVSGPASAQNSSRYEPTDIAYGARLFSMHCIACHGENGDLLPQINLRSGNFPHSPSDRDTIPSAFARCVRRMRSPS